MREIELQELIQIIEQFLDYTQVMRPDLYPIFQLQRDSACRIGEAVDFMRWTVRTNYVRLQPQKRNNVRLLELEDFTSTSINYLINQQDYFPLKYYNKFNYYIQTHISENLYIGEKRVSTHIFRHAKVKEMVQNHQATPTQIQDYLGERTMRAAEQYINSIIYVK